MRRAIKMVIKQQIGLINVKNFHTVVRVQNDISKTTKSLISFSMEKGCSNRHLSDLLIKMDGFAAKYYHIFFIENGTMR